jgi:hypothetical protein
LVTTQMPLHVTPPLFHGSELTLCRLLCLVWLQRGVYQRAADPSGHHLVVPAAQAMREAYPHLEDTGGDKAAAAAAGDAGSLRGSYSSGSARRPLGSRKVVAARGDGKQGLAAGEVGGEEGAAGGVEGGDGVLVL